MDGPEFDGHEVDWDGMMKRMGAFKETEREEMKKLEESVAAAAPAAKEESCCCGGAKAKQEIEPIEVLTDRNAQWRVDLRGTMKPKDRTAIERCVMNELAPDYRRHSRKEEVNQGLTEAYVKETVTLEMDYLMNLKIQTYCFHIMFFLFILFILI